MSDCFGAQFTGTPKGGSVTWRGTGLFAARSLILEVLANFSQGFLLGTEKSALKHLVLRLTV